MFYVCIGRKQSETQQILYAPKHFFGFLFYESEIYHILISFSLYTNDCPRHCNHPDDSFVVDF